MSSKSEYIIIIEELISHYKSAKKVITDYEAEIIYEETVKKIIKNDYSDKMKKLLDTRSSSFISSWGIGAIAIPSTFLHLLFGKNKKQNKEMEKLKEEMLLIKKKIAEKVHIHNQQIKRQ